MVCPSCGTPGAYIGFMEVECINTSCSHFSARLHEEWADQQADEMDNALLDLFEERDPDKDRITLPISLLPDYLDP